MFIIEYKRNFEFVLSNRFFIFQGYNIHINGMYHCTVRYKQLHNLNDQLKKLHGSSSIPSFPPKKLLPLSNNQLEERRALLEKYIQTGRQCSKFYKMSVFFNRVVYIYFKRLDCKYIVIELKSRIHNQIQLSNDEFYEMHLIQKCNMCHRINVYLIW